MPATDISEGSTVVYGRTYQTKVATSMKSANAFLEENRDYGSIEETKEGLVHMAKLSDKGTKK